MRILGVFLISLYCVNSLSAQINESDTVGYQFNAALRGAYQAGNVELLRVINSVDGLAVFQENVVLKTENTLFYQEFFGQKADLDMSSRNYLYYKPFSKVYPYLIGYVSSNYRRDISSRYYSGLGLTYHFLNNGQSSIKISNNIAYDVTNYETDRYNEVQFNGSTEISNWINTLYLQGFHRVCSGKLLIHYKAYWQQSFEYEAMYRYLVSTNLNFKLGKGWFLQTQMDYRFEHVTNNNVKQSDFIWTWGMAYQLSEKN